METRTYRVRIIYDEQVRGEKKRHHIDWNCEAIDRDEARLIAGDYFSQLAALSGVSWPRRIRGYDVTRVHPAATRGSYASSTLVRRAGNVRRRESTI